MILFSVVASSIISYDNEEVRHKYMENLLFLENSYRNWKAVIKMKARGRATVNYYVRLINQTIDYIENHLTEKIGLEEIAEYFHVSKFHFNRMFKTVAGMTLKQYILGRKLTEALGYLTEINESVIDATYHFGFEYPEVFSRAFKKQFGISPSGCRTKKIGGELVKKARIVERDIVNYKGTLTINGVSTYLDGLDLEGIYIEVNVNSEDFASTMQSTAEQFLAAAMETKELDHERLYTVVNCHGEDHGAYTVFYGMQSIAKGENSNFQRRAVPQGWYERFIYVGDMFEIRESFVDDLYRWIIIKEIELNPNGVGMLNIYEHDYEKTKEVQIYVPIKKTENSKKSHEGNQQKG